MESDELPKTPFTYDTLMKEHDKIAENRFIKQTEARIQGVLEKLRTHDYIHDKHNQQITLYVKENLLKEEALYLLQVLVERHGFPKGTKFSTHHKSVDKVEVTLYDFNGVL